MEQTPNVFDYFSNLPEECIAVVLSFATPRDACRLASLLKVFNSIVCSDPFWENFLPSDCLDILARSEQGVALYRSLSRKQLYFHLADNPILIDGGTKSFSLDKSTGKKCYTIAARELGILWGEDTKYWKWHSVPASRFAVVTEVTSVYWLDIPGKLKTSMLSRNTKYSAYLVFKSARGLTGFYQHIKLMVKINGGSVETPNNVYIDSHNQRDQRRQNRRDGWMEIEIGEFMTNGVDDDGEVHMAIMETEESKWKEGLAVQGIEIRPKVSA